MCHFLVSYLFSILIWSKFPCVIHLIYLCLQWSLIQLLLTVSDFSRVKSKFSLKNWNYMFFSPNLHALFSCKKYFQVANIFSNSYILISNIFECSSVIRDFYACWLSDNFRLLGHHSECSGAYLLKSASARRLQLAEIILQFSVNILIYCILEKIVRVLWLYRSQNTREEVWLQSAAEPECSDSTSEALLFHKICEAWEAASWVLQKCSMMPLTPPARKYCKLPHINCISRTRM